MKILMIAAKKMDKGGIESYLMSLFRYLPKDIHIDFAVHSNEIGCYDKELLENESTIYRLPRLGKNPIKYSKQLYCLIKKGNYDIVHRHATASVMWVDLAIAKYAGCNNRIAHSHNADWNHRLLHKLFIPLLNHYSTTKFACSNKAGKWMYGKKSFQVMKNGIDVNTFKFNKNIRDEYRKKYTLDSKKVILMVARMVPEKNHLWFLNVISEVIKEKKDIIFVFAGDGILLDEFKNLIDERNLNDFILVLGSRNDISNLLSMSDIFVLPSLFEGLPITLIEAQSTGLQCLVSSNVTNEVDLGLVRFMDLNVSKWKNIIISLKTLNEIERINCDSIIYKNNYSLEQTVQVMEENYRKCIQ